MVRIVANFTLDIAVVQVFWRLEDDLFESGLVNQSSDQQILFLLDLFLLIVFRILYLAVWVKRGIRIFRFWRAIWNWRFWIFVVDTMRSTHWNFSELTVFFNFFLNSFELYPYFRQFFPQFSTHTIIFGGTATILSGKSFNILFSPLQRVYSFFLEVFQALVLSVKNLDLRNFNLFVNTLFKVSDELFYFEACLFDLDADLLELFVLLYLPLFVSNLFFFYFFLHLSDKLLLRRVLIFDALELWQIRSFINIDTVLQRRDRSTKSLLNLSLLQLLLNLFGLLLLLCAWIWLTCGYIKPSERVELKWRCNSW